MSLSVQVEAVIPKEPFMDEGKMISGLTKVLSDTVLEGKRLMQIYPPAPPYSQYRRTRMLAKSWSTKVSETKGLIQAALVSNPNIAPYSEQVVGETQDAIFKQIGWMNITQLAKELDKGLAERVQNAVNGGAT